jgi:hypothetical protein
MWSAFGVWWPPKHAALDCKILVRVDDDIRTALAAHSAFVLECS